MGLGCSGSEAMESMEGDRYLTSRTVEKAKNGEGNEYVYGDGLPYQLDFGL